MWSWDSDEFFSFFFASAVGHSPVHVPILRPPCLCDCCPVSGNCNIDSCLNYADMIHMF